MQEPVDFLDDKLLAASIIAAFVTRVGGTDATVRLEFEEIRRRGNLALTMDEETLTLTVMHQERTQ